MSKIAIVAALEQEVRPLVAHWSSGEREYSGRRFRFYENDEIVLVCGGIGPVPARRAAEVVIALYQPTMIYSAGFAGALDPKLRVGDVVMPRRVIDAADGSSVDTGQGEGVLISFASVASPAQKTKLANSYGAQAVDMESAAVARAAQARGVRFAAVKAISDDSEFALPAMEPFINSNGDFDAVKFSLFAAVRPWIWGTTFRLARNSRLASAALCARIEHMDMRQPPASQLPTGQALGRLS